MYKIKINIKGCKDIRDLRNFMRDNGIKLVLFGEYHSFIGQIEVQEEIIRNTRPDFFLYELLEEEEILNEKDAKFFLDSPDKDAFSFVSNYKHLKPIVRLARKFKLPIIGCDIKNMGCEDACWMKKKFSSKEARALTNLREMRQSKVINDYISKGLVFAIVGDYHVRKNSLVFSKLKAKKVIVVRPAFRWKEKFNHLGKFRNSEVSYIVRLVNL